MNDLGQDAVAADAKAAKLLKLRDHFNEKLAPMLVEHLHPGLKADRGLGSSRFAYFFDDDRLVIVAGAQEEDDVDLALAYGPTLADGRKLSLVLPTSHAFSTRQRLPWLKPDARPTLHLHTTPPTDSGSKGVAPPTEAPVWTRKDTIAALSARLKPKQTLAAELAEAATAKHLHINSPLVEELVEWATAHPLLDPGHRKGERSWHCMGQRVLSIAAVKGGGVKIGAGIHYSKAGEKPEPELVSTAALLTKARLEKVQERVQAGIEARLSGAFHRPNEHWLQAVIRRDPTLVGVEQPALRELPAWRPAVEPDEWGRGFIDLLGVDGHGDVRIIETKLAENSDESLILQGLDYYVWAQAYAEVLRSRLGASNRAKFVVHYVVGATPPNDKVHVSGYLAAQAEALDIPWRFQVVNGWFQPPATTSAGPGSTLLAPGTLPVSG